MSRDLTDPTRAKDIEFLEDNLKEPIYENVEVPENLGSAMLTIDDHKIKRHAFATNDYHPWAFGISPFGDRIAQAGLITNDIVQLFTLKYAASKTVGLHTEEQLWFYQPIRINSRVTIAGSYTEKYVKRDLGYVVMEAEVTDEENICMIRHRGVEVLRTVPGEVVGSGRTKPIAGQDWIKADYDDGLPFVVKIGRDVRIGSALSPLRRIITQEQASVFSRCGEYIRNVHNDIETARKAKLRIPIVQGQQQMCCILTMLARAFGADWYTSGWTKVKFINPLEVFEPITVGGVIRSVEEEEKGCWVSTDVWAIRDDGVLTTVGSARCLTASQDATITSPVPLDNN